LDAAAPFLVVRAATSKNKKDERVELVPEVVEALMARSGAGKPSPLAQMVVEALQLRARESVKVPA